MTSGAADPLTEHLIRTTSTVYEPFRPGMAEPAENGRLVARSAPTGHRDSAPPVRENGTRVRAGNAMNRTRQALLAGARTAAARYGTHLTMAQVAGAAGVAKATLYNHLRTREDVLAALAAHEVEVVLAQVAELPLAEALETAAVALSEHPVVRILAATEPGVAAALARVDTASEGWALAEDMVRRRLGAGSADGVELVLRWLAGFVLNPADRRRAHAQARLVARAVTAPA